MVYVTTSLNAMHFSSPPFQLTSVLNCKKHGLYQEGRVFPREHCHGRINSFYLHSTDKCTFTSDVLLLNHLIYPLIIQKFQKIFNRAIPTIDAELKIIMKKPKKKPTTIKNNEANKNQGKKHFQLQSYEVSRYITSDVLHDCLRTIKTCTYADNKRFLICT